MIKKSGKTVFSGRRRTVTRKSGFKVDTSFEGTKIKYISSEYVKIKKNEKFIINFKLPKITEEKWVCFGLYYNPNKNVEIEVTNPNYDKKTFENYGANCWSKIGSIWRADSDQKEITVKFISNKDNVISFAQINCGIVEHDFLDINNNLWKNRKKNKKERLEDFNIQIKNLYIYSPEAHFIDRKNLGLVSLSKNISNYKMKTVTLKSCNRCNRFLPINLNQFERKTLSFSNHCGESKTKCIHKSFGIIQVENQKKLLQLRYGFQLECRFCKKFAVNAALNPQRTSSQLKEDSQRRRYFELLLTELYKKSPMLSYRHLTGNELVEDVFKKFNGVCFKCKSKLSLKNKENKMNLDHTRPLALLWQIDGTATALCKECNSKKSAKPPLEFYTEIEIKELSKITGLSLNEIKDPSPNEEAVSLLLQSTDWFFKKFLDKEELFIEKDGKVAAELICKALDKVISKSVRKIKYSFFSEYSKRYHNF